MLFILGAGASRAAGAPVMRDFLDRAEECLKQGKAGNEQEYFTLIFEGFQQLRSIYAKAQLDTSNVESVFAAFEMAALTGNLGGFSPAEISDLRRAVVRVITPTLECSIKFPVSSLGQPVLPPQPYGEFVELLGDLKQRESIDVITFNYDIALDYALSRVGISANYCVQESVATAPLRLMKLHGSLNWTRCCEVRVHFDALQNRTPVIDTGDHIFELTPFLKRQICPKCGKPTPDPMIVPPVWNKTQYHDQLRPVWRNAADALSKAEEIFVIGYSFPPTDQFFHYLYALGSVGPTRLKKFWVFDPDSSVKSRFQSLLGAETLRCFEHRQVAFSDAIDILRKELRVERQRKREEAIISVRPSHWMS